MEYKYLLRRRMAFLLSLACFILHPLASGADSAERNMSVLKEGGTLYIRSSFSDKEDLLLKIGLGANRQVNFSGTFLLDKNVPMTGEVAGSGKIIHGNGDDATPWHLNGTYIGGNHGAAVGWEVECKGHGLEKKDIGSQWQDSSGVKFYLVKIPSADSLCFVGSNDSDVNIWKISKKIKGEILTNVSGAAISFTNIKLYQVKPACRFKKQEYLVEGKTPLKDGVVVSCKWLDIVEYYDIINIGSLLADIIAHPGEERAFDAGHLDGIVSNDITYRFFPNGSNVIYYRSKALQDFKLGYMGFIQSSKLIQGNYQTHEYYIPKTLPFVQDGINYDFAGIQDFTSKQPALGFNAKSKNITDPGNLPERFIQFLGRKNGDAITREVGYALGYSLLHGITVPSIRAANTSNAITVYTTRKSYPNAINSKMGPIIPAGTQFYCVAYRQYFNPAQAGNATCLYWNRQEEDTVVYADYHKSVENDKIRLPEELAGRKFEVVEKSGSVVLNTQGTVPAEGISVTVSDGYGYIVLKVR